MTSYKLAPRDLEHVSNVTAEAKLESPTTHYRKWFPIETMPRAYVTKFYTLEEIPGPALSVDGADYMGVRTARLESENPLLFMRYKLSWDITEWEAARRQNIPLVAENVKVALDNIHNKISQLIIEGIDVPDVIQGATEIGTDLGAGLDTTYLATAGAWITHARAGYNHMITNGFRGPYNLICSDTIFPFLAIPVAGGHGKDQEEYLAEKPYFTTCYNEKSDTAANFAANIEVGLEDICPTMIYTADDGVWVMLAAQPENMALMEVAPPTVYIEPQINRETNKFEGYVEWQGTVRFTHTASVAYMEDADAFA